MFLQTSTEPIFGSEVATKITEYWYIIISQTCLIRTLLIRHFRLIRWGNLKTLKALSLTPVLNYPLNSSENLHVF